MPYRNPETQRSYQRDYKRLRRAGDSQTPGQTLLPSDFRISTARDVLALVDEQIRIVRETSEAGTLERARCIGYLATIALKAVEAADLTARIESLETTLKMRDAK